MSNYFNGKYRINSIRLQHWNYGSNGSYFITICTEGRSHFFGEIFEEKMKLSLIGDIAEQIWFEIPKQFDFVKLEAFVVMPNHIHGIIRINKPRGWNRLNNPIKIKEQKRGGITQEHNPMLHHNLSRIIRWYKGRVTFESRKIHADFGWQSRFHEHIIRNPKSHNKIKWYIAKNPELWMQDRFNSNVLNEH